MAFDNLMKSFFSRLLHRKVISIGTKYFATNELETDYVSLINLTKTMLVEVEPAEINSRTIFENLEREIDQRDLPQNRKFIEIKPAENEVNEFALLSNIIMGNDRYLYVEIFKQSNIMDTFVTMLEVAKGEIIAKSLVSTLPVSNCPLIFAEFIMAISVFNSERIASTIKSQCGFSSHFVSVSKAPHRRIFHSSRNRKTHCRLQRGHSCRNVAGRFLCALLQKSREENRCKSLYEAFC